MKIEIETNELQWWWFNLIQFKIPRFISELQSYKYVITNLNDPLPKKKKGESIRDWLKRIPPKYADRYTSYKYDQAISCYIEVKKIQAVYTTDKTTDKDKKELREILNLARDHFTIAEENYNEVLIRKK